MRRTWVVGVAVLAAGCLGPDRPTEFWAGQIERTDAIPDLNTRGATLEQIAESAAYAGDVTATKYALARLGNGPQRDELIVRCVSHLAAKDQAAARSVAEEIDDRAKRQEALAKLETKPEEKKDPQHHDSAPPTDPGRPAEGR